jgi:hypothetical protein
MNELRQRYEAGEKSALAQCLHDCLHSGWPIPAWAAKAYCEGYRAIHGYEVESWDDILGRRLKKRQHLARARKKAKIEAPLVLEIIRRRKAGTPMDKENMFGPVGKRFGVGATTASEIYYAVPEWVLEAVIDDETSGKI